MYKFSNLAKVECLAALCLMEIFWSLEDANAIANMHSCHQMLCNWHSDTPTKHTEVRFDESCGPMSCHASARNQNRPETAKVSQSPLPQICSSRCFVMWLLLRTTEAPTLFFSSSNQHEARVQTITNENKWQGTGGTNEKKDQIVRFMLARETPGPHLTRPDLAWECQLPWQVGSTQVSSFQEWRREQKQYLSHKHRNITFITQISLKSDDSMSLIYPRHQPPHASARLLPWPQETHCSHFQASRT